MPIPNRSKIPLRSISKLFTSLSAGVRSKLEAAFVEAETQINFHNRSIIDNQERRRLSAYVSAPVITLTQNSRGFDVTWPRLEDRQISLYEAQVDLTSSFANPTVYQLAETSLAVEGVGSTVYIRVRGVRWDGDTGNWSNTVTMEATTGGPITYSRGFDDLEPFYVTNPEAAFPAPLQRLRITPQRQNGGMMIFGSLASDGAQAGSEPAVIVTLNGVTVSSVAATDYFFVTPLNVSGATGLGPVFISHDSFYFGDTEFHTAGTRTPTGSASSSGTHIDWTAANPTVYSITWTGGINEGQSRNVEFKDFNFGVPIDNTITGIQVDYTAGDSNASGTPYDSADIVGLRLLDGGVARGNKVAIPFPPWGSGAKTFGGRTDLWGEVAGFWTPSKINDADFGVLLRGKMFSNDAIARTISATFPVITVYSANETTGDVDIQIRFQTNGGGSVTQCTLNVIEFGDRIN